MSSRALGNSSDVTSPFQLWDTYRISGASVWATPSTWWRTPGTSFLSLQLGNIQLYESGFLPCTSRWLFMQKASLCSLSETHLGIKGFLPWGDAKKVATPLL